MSHGEGMEGAGRGAIGHVSTKPNWLVLSDEQMSKGLPFFLLNDEQMSNWLGVDHQPAKNIHQKNIQKLTNTKICECEFII